VGAGSEQVVTQGAALLDPHGIVAERVVVAKQRRWRGRLGERAQR